MGLYIEGLRIPKKGRYTSFTVYSDGRVVYKFGGDHAGQATEVPQHGDLIDRDELKHKIGQFSTAWEYGQGVSDCWEALIAAPTIIPAEEDT